MTCDQLELLTLHHRSDVERAELASRMLAKLLTAPGDGWMTRADMRAWGFSERDCRHARESAAGTIICGQRGYKATERASVEEIRECLALLESMIRAQQESVSQIRRAAHGRIS